MYKTFLLYGHGGSYNHGGEAISKCTIQLIKSVYPDSRIILSTHFKEQDIQFNIPADDYCERDSYYAALDKASPQKGMYDQLVYRSTIDKITKNMICLSVGGDNYCYDNWHRWRTIHEKVLESGAKSILWSCSIEPSKITNEMLETLRTHYLITVRECCTYNALKEKGLENAALCSDIAFLLNAEKTRLSENFIEGNTVGINLSPLVVRREIENGIIIKNINTLIKFIIDNTDMHIALIPHVVMPMDNDFLLLKGIYDEIKSKERVFLISDKLNAAEYKYIISKCRFGIFARTHATIAAYSSYIPSIAIGYSIKAKGIALDLGFEDYVLPVNSFLDEYRLLKMFISLMENEYMLEQKLKEKIPAYKENAINNRVLECIR